MDTKRLKTITKSAPKNPGVYFFNDKNRRPLYIGKAVNLKNRLASYLKTNDTRIQKMLEVAAVIKFLTTDSDIEALILEARYIKKFKPRYNIMLRDDKQYFFVGFSSDRFPKIFLTHRPDAPDFIGPFTEGTALKTALKFLRNIFPYCACKQKHNIPCLNYHIGKCLGFCCLKEAVEKSATKIQISEYQKNIKAIRNILSGKKTKLVKNLKSEMQKLAKSGRLTKAIELKNKLEKLEKVFQNARIISNIKPKNFPILSRIRDKVGTKPKDRETLKQLSEILKIKKLPTRIEGYDISNIQGTHAVGSMVVFSNGRPDKNEYRKFKIRSKNTPDDTAMLSEMIQRRFRHPEWPFPDLILVDGGKSQLNVVLKTISKADASFDASVGVPVGSPAASRRGYQLTIPVIALTKNEKHIGHKITMINKEVPLSRLPLQAKNLLLHIDSEAHRFAISYHRHLRKNIFKSLPIR